MKPEMKIMQSSLKKKKIFGMSSMLSNTEMYLQQKFKNKNSKDFLNIV